MEFQALIDELSTICTTVSTGDETKLEQLDHEKMWATLFKTGANDLRNTTLLYPMINIYNTRFPSFRNVNPVIESNLKELLDNTKTYSERIVNTVSIFRWLAYLPEKVIPQVIKAAIDLTDSYLDEHHDVPCDFLLALNDGEISDISEGSLDDLFAQIQTEIEGPKKAATLCVYATMCHGIADLKNEACEYNAKLALQFLATEITDEKTLLAGCYYLLFAAEAYQNEPETTPESSDLFPLLKRLIIHNSDIIRKRALKAFRKLIQTRLFYTDTIVSDFLDLFNDFNNKPDFFKVISTFIFPEDDDDADDEEEDGDGVDVSIIQPIVDFVQKHLADTENKGIQGLCLDALCDLGFKDQLFVEDFVDSGLEVSKKLIDTSEVATYPFVANFLTSLNEKFHDRTVDKLSPLVPTIVSALNDDALGVLKQRIYCAGALAQLLSNGIAADQTPRVVDFVINNLTLKDPVVDFNVCSIILPLIPEFGEVNANKIFAAFVIDLKETENDEYLAAWLAVCVKLIKRYTIEENTLNSLVALIMSGELKIFHGTPPHMTMPPLAAPFMLLRAFVKKCPTKALPICQQVIEWLKCTPFSSAPTLLLPLTAGLQSGCIIESLAVEFGDILWNFLCKLDMGDVDELIAVCNTLNSLYSVYPAKMNPISKFLKPLENFAKQCLEEGADEEGGDMMDEEMIEAMPSVANFVFNVYANDEEVEVFPELLMPLMKMLPFHPQVTEVADILGNLVAMLEEKERFGAVLVDALQAIADILLMKKSDLEEFNFEDDLIMNMKQTLKACCKGNKKLIDQVTRDFKKSKAKLNRFNVLIR